MGLSTLWKVIKEGFLEEEILDGAETDKEKVGLAGRCHLWNVVTGTGWGQCSQVATKSKLIHPIGIL